MAVRRVFYLKNKVIHEDLSIVWHPGFSTVQKVKNINELHKMISEKFQVDRNRILEVSTKSESDFGRSLSSFNLSLNVDGIKYTVESAYQSSKVFNSVQGEIKYSNYLEESPLIARKALKDENHENLVRFEFLGKSYDLKPKFMFYDWLYISALSQLGKVEEQLKDFQYFTDIEFNPKSSLNCQARSVVLYLWLIRNNRLSEYLQKPEVFYKNISN